MAWKADVERNFKKKFSFHLIYGIKLIIMSDTESNCSEYISIEMNLLPLSREKIMAPLTNTYIMPPRVKTQGKDYLSKRKSWSHPSKDKDVKLLQRKNTTSGNFLMSLLLTKINICRNSFKTKT